MVRVLNYAIRGLTIVIGIILLSGGISSQYYDESVSRVLGVVLILFGIYRIVLYHFQQQRRDRDDE